MAAAALSIAATGGAAAKGHVDDALFADYLLLPETVSFSVCGKLVNATGCFGAGVMSPPFEEACAVVEDPPVYKKNRVSRLIYILDKRYSNRDPMQLYIYRRDDTITANNDNVVVSYQANIFLGIGGGYNAQCHMANSANFIYAGTNKSKNAVQVDKANFTIVNVGQANVTSITADDRGYVAVTSGNGGSLFDFAPDGTEVEEGYAQEDFVGTTNAWIPQP